MLSERRRRQLRIILWPEPPIQAAKNRAWIMDNLP
jgi:hypothetical protein